MSELSYTITHELQPNGNVRIHLEADSFRGRPFKLPLHSFMDLESGQMNDETLVRGIESRLVRAAHETADKADETVYA